MNIIDIYRKRCKERGYGFMTSDSIKPYDDTTLFCPSGMQQFKQLFKDTKHTGTICNIQSCVRLNDLDQIGDGSHLLFFRMIGMFSFRELPLKDTIDFWYNFIVKDLGLTLDYVTIHPDKYEEWKSYYSNVEVRKDEECTWSDGDITGYCTEFYSNGLEIGNIVNPLGTCIDVGFGFERLDWLVNGTDYFSEEKVLVTTITEMIKNNYLPSNLRQGYVLRKLLRTCYKKDIQIQHKFYYDEIERQRRILERYERLKDKNNDKSKEWWFDTHGINLDDL